MREKILQVLREKGHGVTPNRLYLALNESWLESLHRMYAEIHSMELDKLLILHRSSGSAGVPKGEITLVCLRQEGH